MNDTDYDIEMAKDFLVEAVSDIFSPGRHWEDGEQVIAERWYVRATLADGRRFVHERQFARTHFCEVRACSEDEGSCAGHLDPVQSDAQAQKMAEDLAAKVKASQGVTWEGPFNSHWTEVEPAYGSTEYEKQGCEAERAYQERREAGLSH